MSETKFLNFKNAKVGTTKSGRDSLSLSMSQEQAAALIEEIQTHIGNERGVKLSVFYAEEEAPWGGMKINASAIVSPIQAPGTGFKGKASGGNGKFVPKAKSSGMSQTTKSKAAATLNTEIE